MIIVVVVVRSRAGAPRFRVPGMMKAARSGKVDVSLEGRLGAWLGETKDRSRRLDHVMLCHNTVCYIIS